MININVWHPVTLIHEYLILNIINIILIIYIYYELDY